MEDPLYMSPEPLDSTFLGFDPGGADAFGVAWIKRDESDFETVDTVRHALEWVREKCYREVPIAAGIDTLLHWSVGRSGDRDADRYLRGQLRLVVLSPNSLRGAMTVGGAALAIRLRQEWGGIRLNEAHPKALYSWLTCRAYSDDPKHALAWLKERYSISAARANDHEFDALLSAIATREALLGNWRDLAKVCDDHVFPIDSVTYLWPASSSRCRAGSVKGRRKLRNRR
ncbi:MAG: hypothetical protein ACREEP_01035 [Dongiaceae bacterium]